MALMLVSIDNKNRSLKAHNIKIAALRGPCLGFLRNVKLTLLQLVRLDVQCFMKTKLSLSLSHTNLPNYLNINLIRQNCLCVGEVAVMDKEGGFAERYESFTFLLSVTTSIV